MQMRKRIFGGKKRFGAVGRRFAWFAVIVEVIAGVYHYFVRHGRFAPRARRLASGEKLEITQLLKGEEGWRQYARDSLGLLYDFFIPHHGNDHRPHALRPKSLLLYTVAAVTMKLVVSGALFLYYPTPARLARIVAQEIMALTNLARQAAGVPLLTIDPVLEASARAKGADMLVRDYFAHDGPDGRKPWSWIDRERYDYVYAGENLAVDFISAEAIHEAFMKSPSHRANIVNGRYQNIGVAVVAGTLAGRQTELLVQFFGTRRGATSSLAAARQTAAPQRPAAIARAPRPVAPPVVPATLQPAARPPEPASSPAVAVFPLAPEPSSDGGVAVDAAKMPDAADASDLAGATNEPILVLGAQTGSGRIVDVLLTFSNFFLVALAVFLTIALLLNIVIRVRVQHADLILQSIAVLSLLLAMALTKFHFVERIGNQLRIL